MAKEAKPKSGPRLFFPEGTRKKKAAKKPAKPRARKPKGARKPRKPAPRPDRIEKTLEELEMKEEARKVAAKKIKAQIKKEERPVPEPSQRISPENGKLSLQRPKGYLKKANREKFDFQSIKKQIEASLKRERPKSMKSFGEARVGTGIAGLDEVMQGGFLRNSINMIAGGSGTGKSIFCMHYLVNGIEKFNESGVYISFEERPEKILRDMKGFNWNLEKKIKDKKLAILYYTPEQVEKVLTTGAGTVRDVVESLGAKRVVIDSITAFLLLHERELDKRRVLLKLFDVITKWDCTALLTSEHEQHPERHESGALEFEVDSVVILYYVKKGDVRQRAIEIFKMRATKHASKIFPIQITEHGIVVFPEESVF